ncbi:cell division protein FtsK [Micromonospora sp. NPDC023633]|uniref:cell division protein FtsK n=1 Tax=Micromonospora sp. NPDC023633 TaxID=3154320 RepID=UPI0033D95FDB
MSTDVAPHDLIEDAETVTVYLPTQGGPVDPPDAVSTTWATITNTSTSGRKPIVPAWMLSKHQRSATLRAIANNLAYHVGYHVFWSPKYLCKVVWYAPQGAWKAGASVVWYAAGGKENYKLRQSAANKDDAFTWKDLNKTRAKESKARWWFILTAIAVLAIALAVARYLGAVPAAAWYVLPAALTLAAAYHGRPADKPILDRVTNGPRFTKLTAEMVRAALCSISVTGIKDPAALTFPSPGIHRDGPGWLARVNLPIGVEAVAVLEKRGALSSALRLPVDQVWPAAGPDHAGQLDLWVGYQPSSKMGNAKWALASPSAQTSVFDPIPFGVDQRQRPVSTTLFQRNYLIGGQPGSGKTFAGRAITLGALLDPTCEVWLAAFKPSEDFYDVGEFCTRYVCGVDPATMEAAEQMVADGLREVHRRQKLLGKLKREGRISEGRTDPELAKQGIGLHPLLLVFDEVHELFLESKQAVEDMIRLIKQGRSAGVIVVLITQVADKDSVPPNVTRCVSSRWCLSVADQVANDQIMGTGAYKRGISGTAYRPKVDAGWGATMGISDDYVGPVRAYYPQDDELAVLLDRIRMIRRGRTFKTTKEKVQARDMLADAWACLRPGESGMPWSVLAQRLAELAPEFYAGITADMVRESLARYHVPSQDVKVDGKNLKGVRRTALDAAEQRRPIADK